MLLIPRGPCSRVIPLVSPLSVPTGGALGALFVGLVASNAWEKGVPRFGSLGRSFVFSPESECLLVQQQGQVAAIDSLLVERWKAGAAWPSCNVSAAMRAARSNACCLHACCLTGSCCLQLSE